MYNTGQVLITVIGCTTNVCIVGYSLIGINVAKVVGMTCVLNLVTRSVLGCRIRLNTYYDTVANHNSVCTCIGYSTTVMSLAIYRTIFVRRNKVSIVKIYKAVCNIYLVVYPKRFGCVTIAVFVICIGVTAWYVNSTYDSAYAATVICSGNFNMRIGYRAFFNSKGCVAGVIALAHIVTNNTACSCCCSKGC